MMNDSVALHADTYQKYVLTQNAAEAYRFDGKDVAVHMAETCRRNGLVGQTVSYTSYSPRDGNGIVVMYFVTEMGQPTSRGYLKLAPIKPSISELFDAINEHQAAVRGAISGAKGISELARANANKARDVLITKLAEWGVADKFDLSDLDN